VGGLAALASAPQLVAFEHSVAQGANFTTIDFVRYSACGPNVEVLAQGESGDFQSLNPLQVRTYWGTVREYLGALAAGMVRADRPVFSRIVVEDGPECCCAGERRGAKESSRIRFGQLYPRWWERI